MSHLREDPLSEKAEPDFSTVSLISVSDLPSEVTSVVTTARSATAARTLASGKRVQSSARVGDSSGCR